MWFSNDKWTVSVTISSNWVESCTIGILGSVWEMMKQDLVNLIKWSWFVAPLDINLRQSRQVSKPLFPATQFFIKNSSSQPILFFHNSCRINFAYRVNGAMDSRGSYTELATDEIPHLAEGFFNDFQTELIILHIPLYTKRTLHR